MTMSPAEEAQIKQSARNGWLLSTPALVVLAVSAVGPLFIILLYSFLEAGTHGNVVWAFSTEGWTSLLWTKDIFTDSYVLADAHLTIFWRSVKLSLMTTLFTFVVGFPTAWFIATRPASQRALWLFLITIPFWTNLLIRTYAINEVIRAEGLLNLFLMSIGVISEPLMLIYTDIAIFIGMTYVYLPLMGGGKQMMIGNLIELQFGQGKNWPLGAALSLTLLLIVTVALLYYVRVANGEKKHG
jgi:spermidine/putrescine transport system permease protein